MKNRNLFLALSALFLAALWSCKKQENQVTLESGTAPTLRASVPNNGTIRLDYYTASDNAITFNWTQPAYTFTTGANSQSVFYKIEIDTLGANFTSPRKRVVTVTNELSRSFTHAEFNDLLYTGLQLKDSMQHTIEVRVSSYLGVEAAMLSSERLTFKVTPYDIPPKVTPPTTGKLFITGAATTLSWMGGGDLETAAVAAGQAFTMITPTLYRINSVHLNGDQEFLLVPKYGDWNVKYGYTGAGAQNNQSGDTFQLGGNNFKAPSTSGNYKIEVNFKLGTYTVTPV